MKQRVSESGFSFRLGDLKVRAEKATLTIEDGRKGVKDKGVPNGHVPGEVGATGEMEFDAANMAILAEAAKAAGSWQDIDTFDIMFFCKGTNESQKAEAFGCLLNLSDIINFDPSSDKKNITKVSYEVTDPDFVRINGIPYLSADRTEGLT